MKRYFWLDKHKKDIENMYVHNDYTVDDIAINFNVSRSAISNRLKKWNFRNSDVGRFFRIDIPENIIKNLYLYEDLSLTEISKIFNCGKSTIHRILIKYDINRRGFHGRSGYKNPNWKGGHTPARTKLYSTKEWKNLANFIWKRDLATCQNCGYNKKPGKKRLEIHHIVPFSISEELRMEPSNLILLCFDCHNWIHSNDNINKKFLRGGM